jgi:hypothetical protein
MGLLRHQMSLSSIDMTFAGCEVYIGPVLQAHYSAKA